MKRTGRTRRARALAVAVVAVLAAASCGSDDDTTAGTTAATTAGTTAGTTAATTAGTTAATTAGTTAATTAGTTAGTTGETIGGSTVEVRGVTDDEIVVGGLASVPLFGTGIGDAAQARFDEANASGEIPGGRKIRFVGVSDDQATADVSLSSTRHLIDQDEVFAIVPVISPFISAATEYINEQKTPTVGWGISSLFCSPDLNAKIYGFAFNGCLVSELTEYALDLTGPLMDQLFKSMGEGGSAGHTGAIIGENYYEAKQGVAQVAVSMELSGLTMVYKENPLPKPPTQVTDYTPYVQAIMTADDGNPPDIIYLMVGNPFGLAGALQLAGYEGIIVHSNYGQEVTEVAKGQSATLTFATTEANDSPEMKHIIDVLNAGGVTKIGQFELSAYFSADMFIQILKKVGPDLTPERFQQAASSITYEIPGVVGPTTYPVGFKVGPSCGQIVISDGTTWTIPVPYQCFDHSLNKIPYSGEPGLVQVNYPDDVK